MLHRTIIFAALWASLALPAAAVEIPKEVTPEIRRACEGDVRRLCIRKDSTVSTVKRCVIRNFAKLNFSCKMKLARFGL